MYRMVKGKCVNGYDKEWKYGTPIPRSINKDEFQEIVSYFSALPDQLNPGSYSYFLISEDKELRDNLIAEVLSDYNINTPRQDEWSEESAGTNCKGDVLVIGMPSSGSNKELLRTIAESTGMIDLAEAKTMGYPEFVMQQLVYMVEGIKAIVIKDVENILNIKTCNKRMVVLDTIKGFQNRFQRPILMVGNMEGAKAVPITQQLAFRFLANPVAIKNEK